MKKVMYITFPAYGHMIPVSQLCKELSEKDVEILMYTTGDKFHVFENIENIKNMKYPASYEKRMNEFGKYADKIENNIPLIYYMLYSSCCDLVEFLIEEIKREKPQLIICDSFSIWGKIAANICNIPYGVFFCSFLMNDENKQLDKEVLTNFILSSPTLIKALLIRRRINKKYGKMFGGLINAINTTGRFGFIRTSRKLQPNSDHYSNNIKFLKPLNFKDYKPVKKDTIFISMGTIMSSSTFWNKCIEAVKDLGYEVVISFGGNIKNNVAMKNTYDNVKVYENLTLDEYNEVLERSVLFISHCGFNAVHDAICHNTPILAFPQTSEQHTIATVACSNNCARMLDEKSLDSSNIKEEIINIIEDDNMKKSINDTKRLFDECISGTEFVKGLIEEFDLKEPVAASSGEY